MSSDELDELTDNVRAETFVPAGAHLELQIQQPGGREFRFPFLDSEIAFPEPSLWRARLVSDTVILHNAGTGQSLPLPAGTTIDLEESMVSLIDARQAPVGRLEGISEPYTGRFWTIDLQQTRLGRRGKRFNHIELNHPSISRAHASFLPDQHGRVTLMAESAGSAVSLNGQALNPGDRRLANHGDLLTLGALQFRFHASETAQTGRSLLNVLSLGTFQAALGGPAETGVQLTTKKARWLLAALAANWGTAKPVETLIDWLWPELTEDRGRRNLSHAISRIREELQCAPADFETLMLRTPSTLSLNPERLGSHDYHEVRKLTQSRGALTSPAALELLLSLYKGPYLPTCLEDWAHHIRQSLELDVLGTLLATARYFHGQSDWEPVARAAEKGLELDNLNEDALALLMESCLQSGRPERVIRLYEGHLRRLQAEGLEPGMELVRLHLRATLS
ncbi:MAG: FHA domain-containing protein [Candidatus Eremiobacteraeota bacterium]|nr:FHA domain-containing protein [Candidatus Eremiobacteraeota bacterium]